jgi:hypothetical protein
MNWILLTQDRGRWRAVLNNVMKVGVPWSDGNFLMTSWGPDSLWGRILLHAVSELFHNLSESCPGNAGLRHKCGAMSVRYEQHFTGICKQFWPSLVERAFLPGVVCVSVSLNCAGCGGWEYAIVRSVHRKRGEILKYHKWVGF